MEFKFERKRVVVLGSNKKLEKEIARRFINEGAKVLLINKEDNSEYIINDFGKIDIFINCIGLSFNNKDEKIISKFDDEEWEKVINNNLSGFYHNSKHIINNMLENNKGKIINITSVFGIIPIKNHCAFVAVNAGIIHLTKSMALEMAPFGINVNGIAIGKLKENPEDINTDLSHVPLKRLVENNDIIGGLFYLASSSSDFVTGNIITIDGGWACGFGRDW